MEMAWSVSLLVSFDPVLLFTLPRDRLINLLKRDPECSFCKKRLSRLLDV